MLINFNFNQFKFYFLKGEITSNNLHCQIPFVQNQTDLYHCNVMHQCDTRTGFANCADGKKNK